VRGSDNLHEGLEEEGRWQNYWKKDGWISPASASFSGHERNHLFLNTGDNFVDAAAEAGLDSEADARAWVRLDFDRDGMPDIITVNANIPETQIYRNGIVDALGADAVGNYVAVALAGGNRTSQPSKEWSNRDAVGSVLRLTLDDGRELIRELAMGEGFAAQNSETLLVGIGQAQRVTALAVQWPSGKRSEIADVAAGQLVTLFENPAHSPDGSGSTRADYRRLTESAAAPQATVATKRFEVEGAAARAGDAELRVYATMATWCTSCKSHLPHFESLQASLGDEVALLGLPVDENDTESMLETYVEDNAPAYDLIPALTKPERASIDTLLAAEVGKDVLPSSIVTDAEGRVLLAKAGLPSLSELRALLAR